MPPVEKVGSKKLLPKDSAVKLQISMMQKPISLKITYACKTKHNSI